MGVQREGCLGRCIEHGGNGDDEFLSNGENRDYDAIRDTHLCGLT